MVLQIVIFFLLSLISTIHGDCILEMTKYSTCIGTSAIPGYKTACECWGDFKNVAVSSGCITEEYSSICLQASALQCPTATDCAFGIPATTCPQAFTQKALCLVQAGVDTAKLCGCYTNFESTAKTLCAAGDWMGDCSITNAVCGQDTCKFDCNLLNSYIPDCTSTFDSCTDKCQCYAEYPTCILNSVDFCDLAKVAVLKACVETQLSCVTFAEQCDSTEISIGITDVVDLFNKYKTQFITRLNKTLEIAGTIVEDCIQTATQTKVTFTVSISWNATLTTLPQVIASIETEFVKTLGVKASQLNTYQKVYTQTAAGKRQATRDEIIVEVSSETSGTSMVTAFIAPIIILNGLLLWFLNH